jgi:hypothetical protein
MEITKEQFEEYRSIQDSGMFNMFDPNARACTDLTKNEWMTIIENYDELSDKYEGEDNE